MNRATDKCCTGLEIDDAERNARDENARRRRYHKYLWCHRVFLPQKEEYTAAYRLAQAGRETDWFAPSNSSPYLE